jgi:thiamine-phosphate pyrophosphorylase
MKEDRMMDACINRASEGLRFLEDTARLRLDDTDLTLRLRRLRHTVRNLFRGRENLLLRHRDAELDVGRSVSENSRDDKRSSLTDACTANFKRIQESFRTMEEILKVKGEYRTAKNMEKHRFSVYTLEKQMLGFFRKQLPQGIYGILGEQFSCGRTNVQVAQKMVHAGIDVIQYREKLDWKTREQMVDECREIRAVTRDAGVCFVVNDFADIALAVGADGVHSGQDDLPAPVLKQLAPDLMVGISTHSPDQAGKAVQQGADYIGVGPIFETRTKENVCAPVGLSYLEYAAGNIEIPFVAIGGIKLHNLKEVVCRGARTVCLVTEITGAEDIEETIRQIKTILTRDLRLET